MVVPIVVDSSRAKVLPVIHDATVTGRPSDKIIQAGVGIHFGGIPGAVQYGIYPDSKGKS